jgi:hypothetical protein
MEKESGLDEVVKESSNTTNLSSTLPNYRHTKRYIDDFFASDNRLEEEHSIEESIKYMQSFDRTTNQ